MYFKTNSETLSLDITFDPVMKNKQNPYFSFDIFLNGEFFDSINNFDSVSLEPCYCKQDFEVGNFKKSVNLGDGEKSISLIFPFTVFPRFHSLEIDDGSTFIPNKPEKILLCYGDSITHGYEALHTSEKYTSILARYLNACEYNKGVAGDICVGEMPLYKDDIKPDYITVAYGTNDWTCCPVNIFIRHTKMFYEKVTEAYPDSKIFAISPIWRSDCEQNSRLGEFSDVEKIIKEHISQYKNVTLVEGFDLVPHEKSFFVGELALHPSSEGFKLYAENLYKKIKNLI